VADPAPGDEPPSTDGPLADAAGPAQIPELVLEYHLDAHDTDPPTLGWIEGHLLAAASLAGVSHGRLGVTLIDDERMASLHAEYCDDPSTTDVLTFDLREDVSDDQAPLDGDLAICRDQAQRQAKGRGHDARTELLLYAVHGLLHLLGEDDHDDEDFAQMHRREDELLGRLGFGAVFGGAQETPEGQV